MSSVTFDYSFNLSGKAVVDGNVVSDTNISLAIKLNPEEALRAAIDLVPKLMPLITQYLGTVADNIENSGELDTAIKRLVGVIVAKANDIQPTKE